MIHVIYGDNRFLGLEKVEEIMGGFEDFERSDFMSSHADFDFGRVFEAASTVSMFHEFRLILVHIETEKDINKVDVSLLESILKLPKVVVILWLPKKLEKKHVLSKVLGKGVQEHLLVKEKEAQGSLIKRLDALISDRKLGISSEAKRLLISNLGDDYMRLETEVDKLSLLGKRIEVADVEALISLDITKDVFALGNALIARDAQLAFKIYHDLLMQKQEPLSLLPLIASSLRSIYQVETLKGLGFSDEAVCSQLRMSSGQLWYIKKNQVGRVSNVIELLNTLASIDQGVKLGEMDAYIAFEVFMIALMA
jgi:DNA polymerase III subunit delta